MTAPSAENAGKTRSMRRQWEDDKDVRVAEQYQRYKQEKLQTFTPRRFADVSLDQLDPATRGPADGWLADFAEGQAGNLVLTGPVGVGKTHAALAIGRATVLQADRWKLPTVTFRPVSTLLDELRPDGAGKIEDYTGPALLILDDLGTEKATEWVEERLYVILNERWLACTPTIVTSNLAPDQLDQALGSRTWDRLRDGARAVALAGTSRRRPA